MAAHLRRNIRLYVGGNHFSTPSRFMGARSFSSSSMPTSPNHAPKEVQNLPGFLASSLISGGLLFTFCEGMDMFDRRSQYEFQKEEVLSKLRSTGEADLAFVRREILAFKMRIPERAYKNGNVSQAGQLADSGE